MADGSRWQPKHELTCNIRSECGPYVDLWGGGGCTPALVGYENGTEHNNPNQIWHIYSVPHSDSRVIIKNSKTNGTVASDGHVQNLRCETLDDNDQSGHWFLEGADIRHVKDDTIVRFRNVKHSTCYFDLWGGQRKWETPFITADGHGGTNQAFKLIRR